MPSTDGVAIRLPSHLDDLPSCTVLHGMRALALVQGIRIRRGAGAFAPRGTTAHDLLVRDLFTLWDVRASLLEAGACAPGLRRALQALATAARADRPELTRLTLAERVVETAIRDLLDDGHARPLNGWPADVASPDEVRAWAGGAARETLGVARAAYRGVAPVLLWGEAAAWVTPPGDATAAIPGDMRATKAVPPPGLFTQRRTPRGKRMRVAKPGDPAHARIASPDVDSPLDATATTIDDPRGAVSKAAGNSEPGQGLGEARARVARRDDDTKLPFVEYPEWDAHLQAERAEGARVLLVPPDWRVERGTAWADRILRDQAGIIRRTRRLFEMLQPRRELRPRSRDGDSLDLDAVCACGGRATARCRAIGGPLRRGACRAAADRDRGAGGRERQHA